MKGKLEGKGALVFALAFTLLIRLLALGLGGNDTVHASRLNQTVPTPTPSGMPNTIPTPTTPERTRVRPEPTDTPLPTRTLSVSSTPTAQPTDGVPPQTATAPTETAAPLEPTSGATEQPTNTPAASPPEAAPLPSATVAPGPILASPTPLTHAFATVIPVVVPTASVMAALCSPSCLWPVGGLGLIGAGIIVLARRKRSD